MKTDEFLCAKDSNPKKMGWMEGFPPKENRTVFANDGSFFKFPALRYSVNHMREFYPSTDVPAGKNHYELKTNANDELEKKIDEIQFVPWGEKQAISWKESLDRNYVDGIIILHKGKIIYEKYPAGLKENGIHAAMSVSKSFTGLLASILIDEGAINPKNLVTDYIPELFGSGFEGATVQQVLDMTTAIEYSEDYKNPDAEIWKFSAAGNVFRPADYDGPKNYYDYLKTVKKNQNYEHGEVFGYKTVNTELIGWIISRVSGKGISQLLSEKIWQPMGANYDGYYQVSSGGIAYAGGGLNLNLRDMAIFGEVLRNGGVLKEKKFSAKSECKSGFKTKKEDCKWRRIISENAVNMVCKGGSKDVFEKSGEYPLLKNWSYHNMWWILNDDFDSFMARGVHGQAIFIAPKAKMVIARFASNPLASNKFIDPISIPSYQAVVKFLMKK